jgi:hypothetical protein
MNILKDLLNKTLPWTELCPLLYWHLFRSYLEDDIVLLPEN